MRSRYWSTARRTPVTERFWQYVHKTEACWLWTGVKDGNGYGMIQDTSAGRALRAHRVSFEMAYGPIPEGKIILHECDNPPCVNPKHLRCGTKRDNALDAVAKGRH